MFRVLTRNLDINEILDLLADYHRDTTHVYLEPPKNSDSKGYEDSEDEGDPTQSCSCSGFSWSNTTRLGKSTTSG